MYNPYDIDNAQDRMEAQVEARRLQRDGFIVRPISRTIPPTAGTAAQEACDAQAHPAAGDFQTTEQR